MKNITGRESLVIRSPQDAVSAVPYLLGFHPEDSLVVVAYGGPHGSCALRTDLVPAPEHIKETTGRIADMMARNRFENALLIGYGADEDVAPLVAAVETELAGYGIQVREALRVQGGRWWSYACTEPGCCPVDGTPFDIRTSTVAVQATLLGQVALADRAELARTVTPLGGQVREAMRLATARAERRLAGAQIRARRARPQDGRRIADQRVVAGVPFVRELVGSLPALPADDEIAWLGVLLTHLRVRDEAWVRIDPDLASEHIVLWREVLRRVENPYVPAPASLLAYAAFISGDGGLANVALDRAHEADPRYSMAGLLREVIQMGLPPSAARLRMKPEDLAEAWEAMQVQADEAERNHRAEGEPQNRAG